MVPHHAIPHYQVPHRCDSSSPWSFNHAILHCQVPHRHDSFVMVLQSCHSLLPRSSSPRVLFAMVPHNDILHHHNSSSPWSFIMPFLIARFRIATTPHRHDSSSPWVLITMLLLSSFPHYFDDIVFLLLFSSSTLFPIQFFLLTRVKRHLPVYTSTYVFSEPVCLMWWISYQVCPAALSSISSFPANTKHTHRLTHTQTHTILILSQHVYL